MKKLLQASAAAVTGVVLSAGLVAAQAGSIMDSGPDSTNTVKSSVVKEVEVENDNNVRASVQNDQDAESGHAMSTRNTTGGGATSGDATNDNNMSASVSVDNSGMWSHDSGSDSSAMMGGSIENTGPDSSNRIESSHRTDVDISNKNDMNVTSSNDQSASSGDATVSRNTTGGTAHTGSASNTSTSSFVFTVKN